MSATITEQQTAAAPAASRRPARIRIVLCRRVLSDFGEQPVRYCAKPIKTPNASDLCDACRKNFPLWPA